MPEQAATPAPTQSAPVTTDSADLNLALFEFNTRYVFVEQLAQVARIPTESRPSLDIYHPSQFASALESNRKAGGKGVARCWLNWAKRKSVYRLVYAPGEKRFTEDGNLNTWMKSKVKAIKGDISLWIDYLDRIFASDPTYRDWFLAWLAYPIQHPGTKLHTAVVFWSEQTATGKSMLGRIMSAIYGPHNYAQIDEATLHNPFNFWMNGRQFIMGEEMKGISNAKHIDRMKAMITQQVCYVNIKNRAQFELKDCINYYFTSNHPDALFLDSNDRRFFVHNLGDKRYPADLYRNEFEPWFLNGGAEAIRYYLEHIDLSQPIVGGDPTSLNPAPFNPGAAAPQSTARKQMVSANRDEAEEWLEELRDWPGMLAPRTLLTAPELFDAFLRSHPHSKIPYKTFCTRLRSAVKPVYSDNKLTLTTGRTMKVYPLPGEEDKWVKVPHDTLVSSFEAQIDNG